LTEPARQLPARTGLALVFGSRNWLLPAALVAVLAGVGVGNYLLFHILAELFAVIVAVLLFAVAWQTYPFSRNGFLMVLACGYFWVGMADLVHALVYKGMGIFDVASANPATQLWLAARYGQSILLLAAPFFVGRAVRRSRLFIAFGGIFAVFVALVMGGWFPDAYVDGRGLTPFKIASEYVIIAILALALVHLFHPRMRIENATVALLSASIGLTMAAELCFTFYVGIYDFAAEAGHIFKLLSFWFLFEAIVRTTLEEPYRLLEARVEERTADLRREIEKRQRAETAIGASEARLRAILEHSPAIVTLKDLEGKYLLVNAEFERLLQVGRADALGRRASDVVETEAARRLEANHAAVMRTRQARRFEYETVLSDGGRHHLMAIGFPVFGDDGTLVAVGTISTDVTEDKKTEEQLRHAQKVQSLGDLAGGLAHEFNNILQPIVALSGVVAQHVADGPDRRALDMILKAALRARDLVAQVQTFSRQDTLARTDVDLGEALQAPLDLVRSTVPSSVDLTVAVEPGAGTVKADAGQMGTVLLNLVSNAVDALPQRTGRIAISLATVDLDPAQVAAIAGLKPGRHVCLSVADNGHGMDAETAARVFDPFFSTKEVGRGTGLGLSVVHGIVAAHGGAVTVSSAPDGGTRFDVYLPLRPAIFGRRAGAPSERAGS
jgi:PAS domain S-box-containing protein